MLQYRSIIITIAYVILIATDMLFYYLSNDKGYFVMGIILVLGFIPTLGIMYTDD